MTQQLSATLASAPSPSAYRPAPAPPTPLSPSIDRSTSQRAPVKTSKPTEQLPRANSTKDKRSPGPGNSYSTHGSKNAAKPSPGSSSSDLPLKQGGTPSAPRDRDPRAAQQNQQPSPAVSKLAKVSGVATPRHKEKKDSGKEVDIVKRLQQICTDADPTKLYRNLVKIGQGWVIYFPFYGLRVNIYFLLVVRREVCIPPIKWARMCQLLLSKWISRNNPRRT
jgi:p21-activated kinase 1